MSKPNRRRQRPGSQPAATRPTGTPPTAQAAPSTPVSGSTGGVASPSGPAASGAAGGPGSTATPRPTGTSARPTGSSARAGRRERQRSAYQPSFMERYRTPIVVVAALLGVALISVFVFFSASQPAFACTTVWAPAATASPAAGATPALGYVQPDQGRQHDGVGDKVTYTYCAPASGSHYNRPGVSGPIPPRVYSPSDNVLPQGWIHNLEHGGMVVLYQGSSSGATPDGQTQFRAFYDTFPPGPVCGTPKGVSGPVIARFDQMSSPFQVIVWGRVLFLDAWDPARALAFWAQWGERTNPEKQCAPPSAAPSATPIPSVSATPSPS